MIAITTSSSIRVKPRPRRRIAFDSMIILRRTLIIMTVGSILKSTRTETDRVGEGLWTTRGPDWRLVATIISSWAGQRVDALFPQLLASEATPEATRGLPLRGVLPACARQVPPAGTRPTGAASRRRLVTSGQRRRQRHEEGHAPETGDASDPGMTPKFSLHRCNSTPTSDRVAIRMEGVAGQSRIGPRASPDDPGPPRVERVHATNSVRPARPGNRPGPSKEAEQTIQASRGQF